MRVLPVDPEEIFKPIKKRKLDPADGALIDFNWHELEGRVTPIPLAKMHGSLRNIIYTEIGLDNPKERAAAR
eukprot:gene1850-1973_t